MRGRNVFACLVHERPECVGDLVANLRFLDPDSVVLLYDGSRGGSLEKDLAALAGDGVLVHPAPREMTWGALHGFALDCMRHALETLDFDTITVVDSDQLAVRPGYSAHLAAFLKAHPDAGCLVSAPGVQPVATRIGPAQAAWREIALWRPFLRRFPQGERSFPHWTFWPSTVFTRAAAADLLRLFDDPELQAILAATRIWATEEVILPSLVALAGHQVVRNLCSYELVRYRTGYTVRQVDAAMARGDVFWIHPVPRRCGDPVRSHIRARFGNYLPSMRRSSIGMFSEAPAASPLLLMLPLLRQVEAIEGWLSREEADLLAAVTRHALARLPPPHRVVEVGSYCGRSTVVLGSVAKALSPDATVHAVDPHDGVLGTRQAPRRAASRSSDRFASNIAQARLLEIVHPVTKHAYEVEWDQPIDLLVIDHLHDYASVASDFSHFQPWVVEGGLVAFHDYASYFPGVQAFVDHLLRSGAYEPVQRIQSMAVVRKVSTLQLPALHPILESLHGVQGWLDHDEAALLIMTAAQVLTRDPEVAIVEIGSYCGRGTVVLGSVVAAAGSRTSVHAVDTFDGLVGAAGAGLLRLAPTLDRFIANIAAAGLSGVVQVHRGPSSEVELREPIGLLVVDGLHDYASVAADFRRFEPQMVHGGLAAFHDFADYYPGVLAFVGEVLRQGRFEQVARVGSLIVLRKEQAQPATGTRPLASVTGAAPGLPMVSCIMPTYNRRAFVPQAIRHFLDQDYPDRELIVVDDGTDTVEDLIPADPRIRYVRLSRRRTLGAKRNIGCEQARGQILVNWDDDDWIANWRLRYQVSTLLEQDVDISGLSTVFFCDIRSGKGWRYQYPAGHRPWVHDPTFCYRRELWESTPFPDTNHGIDTRYLWQGRAKRIGTLADPSFYVGIVHSGNTSRKNTSDSWWLPYPVEEIAALMGPDWLLYQRAVDGAHLVG